MSKVTDRGMKAFKSLEWKTTTLKNKNILIGAFDVYIDSNPSGPGHRPDIVQQTDQPRGLET